MDAGEISYIFPEGFKTDEYILPETANESNITFANRDYIIDSIIPDENKILKDLLRAEPYTDFGYIHKGKKITETIIAASKFLGFNARHIIKTIITEDTDNNIYKLITRGNFGHINIIKPSQEFRDKHNIDLPLILKPIDKDLVQRYTGTENGFCRPVPLDDTHMDNLKGILIQNKIRNADKLDKMRILLTFPIGYHESLLIQPKELYQQLNDNYPDKVTFFK